jgi:hypothetical protein
VSLQDAGHPSCCGELVPVLLHGEVDPATALTTDARYDVSLDQLAPLFDPARWPDVADFWCSMQEEGSPTGSAVRTFLEVVASDCGGPARLSTRLDFVRRDLPDGSRVLEYWLHDDQTAPADGLVVVDEGSILVEPTKGGVRVRTTKRIRFVEPLDGAHLAMTACAFGWDGAADAFVYGAEHAAPG